MSVRCSIPGVGDSSTFSTSAKSGASLDESDQAKIETSDSNLESSSQPFTSGIEEEIIFRPQTDKRKYKVGNK